MICQETCRFHTTSIAAPDWLRKGSPDVVAGIAQFDLQQRVVDRSGGAPAEFHPGFQRRAVAFPGIAAQATGHHVFPVGHSTATLGRDVIETQLAGRKAAAAVLAAMGVAGEDVPAVQTHVLPRQMVEPQQTDDARDLDAEMDRANPLARIVWPSPLPASLANMLHSHHEPKS
jgi:hypothetical protein